MKKQWFWAVLLVMSTGARAQDIPSIIGAGISQVIRAVDLHIQRMQTKTIALQEAQKALENIMSATELDAIRDWVQRQKDLYGEYFQELWQVKTVITGYHRVKEAIGRQESILQGYQRALGQFRQEAHFSAAEISHIEAVLAAILLDSEQHLRRLMKGVGLLNFQMTDQQRLALIDASADGIDRDYRELRTFTQENQLLSLQRARDGNDYFTLLKLYGL